jgi:hypothetical protein
MHFGTEDRLIGDRARCAKQVLAQIFYQPRVGLAVNFHFASRAKAGRWGVDVFVSDDPAAVPVVKSRFQATGAKVDKKRSGQKIIAISNKE